MNDTEWFDSSKATYAAQSCQIGPYIVTVCEDDEGPLRPAFYWDVMRDGVKVTDGWAGSVRQARDVAVETARSLEEQ